jgi:hypothetical protein
VVPTWQVPPSEPDLQLVAHCAGEPTPWLYFNAILTDSQLFVPVLDQVRCP